MSTKEHIAPHTNKPSLLNKFSLGFEYNLTWQEARREVKVRTQR